MHHFQERYSILRPLGGTTFLAEDRFGKMPVVLKKCRDEGPFGRREVAALLALQMPGVVRLLEVEGPYMVMEFVEGEPFPQRASWNKMRELLVALLQVLRQIHALEVIHRDLKPEHIRIRSGAVVLLDFGAAAGEGVDLRGAHPEGGAGDLAYMAPEQFLDPEEAGPTADLFAVGVMAYEALSGVAPFADMAQRLRGEFMPIQARVGDLPNDASRLINGLLQRQPSRRPANAEAALAMIGVSAQQEIEQAFLHWQGGVPDPADLCQIFEGPERIFGRRSRAMEILRRRAPPERWAEELSAWLSAGRAHWHNGSIALSEADAAWLEELNPIIPLPPSENLLAESLEHIHGMIECGWPSVYSVAASEEALNLLVQQGRIWKSKDGRWWAKTRSLVRDRPALHREWASIRKAGEPGRLRHLRMGDMKGALLAEVETTLPVRLQEGRDAKRVAELGLKVAREIGEEEGEWRMLKGLAVCALSDSGAEPVRNARYECTRSALPPEKTEPLVRLLMAAERARQGDADRAMELLVDLPAFEEEALDRWRVGFAVEATLRGDPHGALGRADRWALERKTVTAAADVAGWRANLEYLKGNCEGGVALCEEAVRGKRNGSSRFSSLATLAANLLELRRFAEAEERGRELVALSGRFPVAAGVGEWVLRSSAYRQARWDGPDGLLAEAAERLMPDRRAGQILVTEAAFAWRVGEYRTAGALARRAAVAWQKEPVLRWMALAMEATAEGQGIGRELKEGLREGLKGGHKGPALQGIALLSHRYAEEMNPLRQEAIPYFFKLPPLFREGIREFVELKEGLQITTSSFAPLEG